MYRELTADDHLRVLGIEREQLPDVLALVGTFDVQGGAERFSKYIEDPVFMRTRSMGMPSYLGRSGELKVAVAAAFGGPMAAMFAHTFAGAGVPVILQLGWAGALQPGSKPGDVYVPHHAERQDGVSDWYLSKGILADATPGLAAKIAGSLREAGVDVSERGIYSTPALLAESREIIGDWSRHGYQAVDMETAATFAVAKALGADRAAALMRIDDLVGEEHGLAHALPKDVRTLLREREELVTRLSIAAAGAWLAELAQA